MGKRGGGVPDRWEDYSNVGSVVEGTRFLAFKVPLKAALLSQVTQQEKKDWAVSDLITACPTISLVVDLTNTYRYYSPKELEGQGVKHVKILTEGRVVPSEGVVHQFYRYLRKAPLKCQFHTRAVDGTEHGLIGVHCTHGLNRTGYLVCRYMIEKLGWDPEKAIQAFDLARGHTQERANYLHNLRVKGWETRKKRRSGSGEEPQIREDGKSSALDRASKFMRESSQKEVEINREPLPPGEQQVEVERAWLIGRDSVVRSTETTSEENQVDREEDLEGVTREQNHPRRGESRPDERGEGGQLAERRHDLGAGRRHNSHKEEHERTTRNPWESHQDQPWKERGHFQGQGKEGGYNERRAEGRYRDHREDGGYQDYEREGYMQNWGRDCGTEKHARLWENGRDLRVHGSFQERPNRWNNEYNGDDRSRSSWGGRSTSCHSTGSSAPEQRWGSGQGWNSGFGDGANPWERAAHNDRSMKAHPRGNHWGRRGNQGGSWGYHRNQSWPPHPEASRLSSSQHDWNRGGEGGSMSGSSWENGSRRGTARDGGSRRGTTSWEGGIRRGTSWEEDAQQRRAFLDRQAHLERSALIVERSSQSSERHSHPSERQDRPRQRKKFIQTPGGAFA